MSNSPFILNQRISNLYGKLQQGVPTTSTLSQVLANGNDAGGQSITNVNNINLSTINGNPYPPSSSANLSTVLAAGNTANNSVILTDGTITNTISKSNVTLTDGTGEQTEMLIGSTIITNISGDTNTQTATSMNITDNASSGNSSYSYNSISINGGAGSFTATTTDISVQDSSSIASIGNGSGTYPLGFQTGNGTDTTSISPATTSITNGTATITLDIPTNTISTTDGTNTTTLYTSAVRSGNVSSAYIQTDTTGISITTGTSYKGNLIGFFPLVTGSNGFLFSYSNWEVSNASTALRSGTYALTYLFSCDASTPTYSYTTQLGLQLGLYNSTSTLIQTDNTNAGVFATNEAVQSGSSLSTTSISGLDSITLGSDDTYSVGVYLTSVGQLNNPSNYNCYIKVLFTRIA